MMQIKSLLKPALTIVVAVSLVLLLDYRRTRQIVPKPQIPEQLATLTGESIDLIALSKQQPVLVYFWASWCGPCKAVSPSVQWLSKHYAVVSFAMDSGDAKEVSAYMQSADYDFSVINDPEVAWAQAFGVQATPTVVILKNGEVVSKTMGVSTPIGLWLRLVLA